ncbi:HlyD family secretion protein [Magnetospirillum molischianum]|uniref:Multidrug resistance protein A n=1 Tax=Magnetospirillum molischianum DSM 120 TaxID=1150626 RepID=H8FUF9_MAGML|nr:HlyD family efflux transporter periplasmic adaptor subunit [Magnetospirillum molischianum]CCG41997.1 Multidrug resistance protein A [Magnetospirillum molischianum DSM 120]
MTDTPPPPTPNDLRNRLRRKLLMSAAALGFTGLGVAYGLYWWTSGRFDMSTDDAYVAGNIIQVSPQIAGTVTSVHADDTDFVEVGQTLVTIDPADTRLALDQAEANLAETVRQVRALFSQDGALAATVSVQETTLARLQEDLARRQRLADTGAVSSEELKHARDAVLQASAQLASARKQQETNRVLIDMTSLTNHPRVARAAAQVRESYLAWRRTSVPAPISGQVARRAVQVGQRTTPGTPLMAIVPLNDVWVDANFKEGQLGDMRIGQPALLTADIYGDKVQYRGTVVGLAAGTGSAFSLLPAQNATGNWIKVVQRVPVRIAIDPLDLTLHPLLIGLSMEVHVSVKDQTGPQISSGLQKEVVAQTGVFADLDHDADALIETLIARNARAEPTPTGTGGR